MNYNTRNTFKESTNADLKISLYVRVHTKTIASKFRILDPKSSRGKSWLLFNIFCCFCMFVIKHFIFSGAHNSKSRCCYTAKLSTYYFYVKTKISIDFENCISVPLITAIDFLNVKIFCLELFQATCTH